MVELERLISPKPTDNTQDGKKTMQQTPINYVYILRCSDGTFYTGWTNNIEKRLVAHNSGKAAKYTRARTPVELAYLEPATDRLAAQRREYEIKKLTRAQKADLIEQYSKSK